MMCLVTKDMPIGNIDGRCCTNKTESSITFKRILWLNDACVVFNDFGDKHTHIRMYIKAQTIIRIFRLIFVLSLFGY